MDTPKHYSQALVDRLIAEGKKVYQEKCKVDEDNRQLKERIQLLEAENRMLKSENEKIQKINTLVKEEVKDIITKTRDAAELILDRGRPREYDDNAYQHDLVEIKNLQILIAQGLRDIGLSRDHNLHDEIKRMINVCSECREMVRAILPDTLEALAEWDDSNVANEKPVGAMTTLVRIVQDELRLIHVDRDHPLMTLWTEEVAAASLQRMVRSNAGSQLQSPAHSRRPSNAGSEREAAIETLANDDAMEAAEGLGALMHSPASPPRPTLSLSNFGSPASSIGRLCLDINDELRAM